MRFSYAYYLLLLYSTVILRMALPVISDALEHEFAEQIHIATVHAKYGANHLQAEVANTAADNKQQNSLKGTEISWMHISENSEETVTLFDEANMTFISLIQHILPFVHLAKHAPPPKFLV